MATLAQTQWIASSPLQTVWVAGNFSTGSKFRKKLDRRKCLSVDITANCKFIHDNYNLINLQIAAKLLLGLCRISQRQMSFLLEEAQGFAEILNVFRKPPFTSKQITLAAPRMDISMDLSRSQDESIIEGITNSLKLTDFLVFTFKDMAQFPEPPENLYTAKEGEITLKEEPVNSSTSDLEQTVPDDFEGGFGNESDSFFEQDDSPLGIHTHPLTQQRETTPFLGNHVPDIDHTHNPADTSHDQVILVDDEPDDFGPGVDEDDSDLSIVPQLYQTSLLTEAPVHQHENRSPNPSPSTPSEMFSLASISPEDLPVKAAQRKRRHPVKMAVWDEVNCLPEEDGEQLLPSYRTRDVRDKLKLCSVDTVGLKAAELMDLNRMPFLHNECAGLLKRVSIGLTANESWDNALMPPPSTPGPSHNSSHSSGNYTPLLSIERKRLQEDPFLAEQSDQPSKSAQLSGHSLKSSSSVFGGSLTRVERLRGVEQDRLTPIVDDEEEPDIDDNYMDYDDGMMDSYDEDSLSSPTHLETSPTYKLVAAVEVGLSKKKVIQFTDLLPSEGVDRKSAASAFFNLLCAASKSKLSYKLRQDMPYGPIIIVKK